MAAATMAWTNLFALASALDDDEGALLWAVAPPLLLPAAGCCRGARRWRVAPGSSGETRGARRRRWARTANVSADRRWSSICCCHRVVLLFVVVVCQGGPGFGPSHTSKRRR